MSGPERLLTRRTGRDLTVETFVRHRARLVEVDDSVMADPSEVGLDVTARSDPGEHGVAGPVGARSMVPCRAHPVDEPVAVAGVGAEVEALRRHGVRR